jgi:uncharacterized membrane protein SirB2
VAGVSWGRADEKGLRLQERLFTMGLLLTYKNTLVVVGGIGLWVVFLITTKGKRPPWLVWVVLAILAVFVLAFFAWA